MKNKNENQESGDFVEINTEFSEIVKTIESKRKKSKNKNYFYNAFYEAIINIDYEKDKGNWAKFIKENQNIYKEILKISSLFKQDQEKLNHEENIFSKSNILNLVESIQEKNTLSKEEIAEFIEKIKSFMN